MTSLAERIARRLEQRLVDIQATGRRPRVALTGGTIAVAAYRELSAAGVDWSDVDFWWGDERFVPDGHTDRNDQQARDAFLDRLGVPAAHVHAFGAHDCAWSAREAADAYAATLPASGFDLVLLGLGPDGHVASLFPGFPQLHETERPVAEVFDSPKPPPVRLTLTFPTLNDTEAVWFLVSGAEKAAAVARARADDGTVDETPARGVRGRGETLWLTDDEASAG
ncbi:6-phosphogluconolactonase [Aeromicrobium marinum DSM 15272]|uniref:6-phosphogluconolactonase n=1 Tax=Aeromicrobium marinum DSM 15272 TaxID=585531 RepID=E2SA37_9ACTN|nr:6-phosphogluconolactonase [Aeromicrobium marinum]EFQ84111.1 6-phosphogluconolactonase [Aeromicrobium marinum DSM 15272]